MNTASWLSQATATRDQATWDYNFSRLRRSAHRINSIVRRMKGSNEAYLRQKSVVVERSYFSLEKLLCIRECKHPLCTVVWNKSTSLSVHLPVERGAADEGGLDEAAGAATQRVLAVPVMAVAVVATVHLLHSFGRVFLLDSEPEICFEFLHSRKPNCSKRIRANEIISIFHRFPLSGYR